MAGGSIKASMLGGRRLAGVAVLLLITLSSMGILAAGREVVIHDNGDYTVTYRDKLLPTSPRLTVAIEGAGKQSKVIVYSYILTPTGHKYYKSAWGVGKASIEVAGAVEEVAQGLRSLGWKGDTEGLPLLLLILYAEEAGRGVVVESKMINVPIIPGQSKGKDIAVTIQRSTLTEMAVEEDATGISVEESGIEGGQDVIPMLCIDLHPDFETCYRWTLNKTLHEAYVGVPLQITRIDSYNDAAVTRHVNHILRIELARNTIDYIKLNAGYVLGQQAAILSLGNAGPTFVDQVNSSVDKEMLVSFSCIVYNEYLTSDQSVCAYEDGTRIHINGFNFYADIMTGIIGNVGVSVYNFERAFVSWGHIPGWDVIGNGAIMWMIPVSDGNGKLLPWFYVDDWLGDGYGFDGVTDEILESSQPIWMPSQPSMVYMTSSIIEREVQGSSRMALAIDVGALLAMAVGSGSLPAWLLELLPALVVGFEYGGYTEAQQHTIYIYQVYSADPSHIYYPVMYKTELSYQEFVSRDMYEVPRSVIRP